MTFPITNPTTPEGREAVELHERATAAAAAVERLEAERADAQEEKARLEGELQDALTAAYADGKATTRKVTDLTARLKTAEERIAEPWGLRIEAARAAASRLEGDRYRFVGANFEEVHEEFAEEAQEARDRLLTSVDGSSVDELHAAFAEYQAVADRVRQLADYAIHIDRSDVAAVRPSMKKGNGRTFGNCPRRLDRPEDAVAAVRECRAGDGDLDAALPPPLRHRGRAPLEARTPGGRGARAQQPDEPVSPATVCVHCAIPGGHRGIFRVPVQPRVPSAPDVGHVDLCQTCAEGGEAKAWRWRWRQTGPAVLAAITQRSPHLITESPQGTAAVRLPLDRRAESCKRAALTTRPTVSRVASVGGFVLGVLLLQVSGGEECGASLVDRHRPAPVPSLGRGVAEHAGPHR